MLIGPANVLRCQLRDGKPAHAAQRRPDALERIPAITAQRVAPAGAEAPLADGTERREHEIEERGDPLSSPRGTGSRGYGWEVFQRRHDGHRSNQDGWVVPHDAQR